VTNNNTVQKYKMTDFTLIDQPVNNRKNETTIQPILNIFLLKSYDYGSVEEDIINNT